MRAGLTTSVMPKGVEPSKILLANRPGVRAWQPWVLGFLLVLATLGGPAANAQGVGSANGRMPGPAQRSRSSLSSSGRTFAPAQRGISYNRVTTARQEVVFASSPAARVARPG